MYRQVSHVVRDRITASDLAWRWPWVAGELRERGLTGRHRVRVAGSDGKALTDATGQPITRASVISAAATGSDEGKLTLTIRGTRNRSTSGAGLNLMTRPSAMTGVSSPRDKAKRMVTCVFCGLHRPGSEEDVVSKWIQRTLNIKSEITIRAGSRTGETGSTEKTGRAKRLVVTVRDMVCEDCNNKWMSQLENRVKDFLVPALTHERGIELDESQQRDLAKWAVMKVLLMEHSSRQFRAHLRTQMGYLATEAELAWMCEHDGPPPRSRVWLAAFDAENRYAITTQSRLGMSAPTPSASRPIPAHVTTLTVGYVLLQVATTDFVLAAVQSLPDFPLDPPWPYSEALSRIWPRRHPVVKWPTGLPVAPNVLDKVANWGLPSVNGARLV